MVLATARSSPVRGGARNALGAVDAVGGVHSRRLRGPIVVLWRAGLRIHEALTLAESDLARRRGSLLVRPGKGGRRREVGMPRPARSCGASPMCGALHAALTSARRRRDAAADSPRAHRSRGAPGDVSHGRDLVTAGLRDPVFGHRHLPGPPRDRTAVPAGAVCDDARVRWSGSPRRGARRLHVQTLTPAKDCEQRCGAQSTGRAASSPLLDARRRTTARTARRRAGDLRTRAPRRHSRERCFSTTDTSIARTERLAQ
jgi:hypothetical protein